MNTSEKKYYITHLVKEALPTKGLRKLFFYTGTAESIQNGKYFWGKGNNENDISVLKTLIKRNEIIELSDVIPLISQKGIWVDSFGKVFLADIKDPIADIEQHRLKPIVKYLIAQGYNV